MAIVKENILLQRLEETRRRYEELERLLGDPKTAADTASFARLAKERARLIETVEAYREYRSLLAAEEEALGLLTDPSTDPDFAALAESEVKSLLAKKSAMEDRLRMLLIPKDPLDDRNLFLEIRAGTGGEEASLFASELLRMYLKYAERQGWRTELMSTSTTGLGGIKEAIVLLEGKGIYSRLKHESGVHRVQRVPETEAGGRIHTSTVTVAVIPEAEEVDIQIDPKDLRIDTFCASGPGGQGVNTTHSAVRITHIPTGLVVSCQDERSQLKNKAKGMRILRSRLMEIEQQKQSEALSKTRKAQVGTGDRSEKIRTYNFPQSRITDHRIGLTVHQIDQVLEGNLDPFVEALCAAETAAALKAG
jgi:peptide chain release factor 1